MRATVINVLFFTLSMCYGQGNPPLPNPLPPSNLHIGLTERIGNFSVELLYHATKQQQTQQNLILSPITVWTVLAVISEGATEGTLRQINHAIRIKTKSREAVRQDFREIARWLRVNTKTVQLAKINAIFVHSDTLPRTDFSALAKNFYDTDVVTLNFNDSVNAANSINHAIANVTHGRIPKIVDSSYFQNSQMILTSALYFKGQWTFPFNATSTSKMSFYSSLGQKIGEVNMMYNRHNYPFANIQQLQARVIEIPYGKENRLSMLIMLPHPDVSLDTMFYNFQKITLDKVFEELKISKEEFGDDEVDCLIPRFKIESNIDLTEIMRNKFNMQDLFDESRARLPRMAAWPVYVSKMIHKAEIEVSEEGTTASGVTVVEFSNRIGVIRFEANRPFSYVIIEKITNSIVFGGVYQEPSLY
ncbi:serine protease inhibitor 77Ba-like [Plodia interpunctella]|uniref:serine protease inhibitor 77Ba-like n=1 Tax=Plodia interpunctella TaxID=58824 RepID=UPI00236843AB|nr:serine protease inhibitor 77Ba-like [Plodia interpunctella]